MELKFFDKWSPSEIVVKDLGLKGYINLDARTLPYSFGMHANKRFGKTQVSIIERLANKLTVTGHLKDTRVHKRISGRDSGKKQRTLVVVRKALEKIEQKTKKNPIQVLIQALENAAPNEETTRIRQGGIIAHRAVDVSPERRLDIALSFITHGAGQRAFKKKSSIENGLAEEIIAASNYDVKTYSISKREELERVAGSAR